MWVDLRIRNPCRMSTAIFLSPLPLAGRLYRIVRVERSSRREKCLASYGRGPRSFCPRSRSSSKAKASTVVSASKRGFICRGNTLAKQTEASSVATTQCFFRRFSPPPFSTLARIARSSEDAARAGNNSDDSSRGILRVYHARAPTKRRIKISRPRIQ